ncbi:MAG: hypothetical protein IPM82_08760 [Saprospiraceae bacterium]|nr:hypothetical protein [Saprospiraceae bacterium]
MTKSILLKIMVLIVEMYIKFPSFNEEVKDEYLNKEKKEIPGTINVKFDPTGFNSELMGFTSLLDRRIKENNKPLIDAEWDEYYAYKILMRNLKSQKRNGKGKF